MPIRFGLVMPCCLSTSRQGARLQSDGRGGKRLVGSPGFPFAFVLLLSEHRGQFTGLDEGSLVGTFGAQLGGLNVELPSDGGGFLDGVISVLAFQVTELDTLCISGKGGSTTLPRSLPESLSRTFPKAFRPRNLLAREPAELGLNNRRDPVDSTYASFLPHKKRPGVTRAKCRTRSRHLERPATT